MAFLKFWGSMAEEATETAMKKSIKLAADIAPNMVSAAQIRMIEDEVVKAEGNLAKARLALKEDMERNEAVDEVLRRGQKAMQDLKGQYDQAVTDRDEAKITRLKERAVRARAEFDEVKAKHEAEHANDEGFRQSLETYQKLYDTWKAKLDQIRAFNEGKKAQLDLAKAKRQQEELNAEAAAELANAENALNMFSSINVVGAAFDDMTKEEELKTEKAKLKAERLGTKAGSGELDAILAEAKPKSTDPFDGL